MLVLLVDFIYLVLCRVPVFSFSDEVGARENKVAPTFDSRGVRRRWSLTHFEVDALLLVLQTLQKDPEGIKEYGIDKLVRIAAIQLSDQRPESKEVAY